MKSLFRIVKSIPLGLAFAIVACSAALPYNWKAVKNQQAYSQYYACDYQLPMGCYIFEDFHNYELDKNGKTIPFVGPPETNLTKDLPPTIEWYKEHTKDWKESLVHKYTGTKPIGVYKHNILGVLEAGTKFRVLNVYENASLFPIYSDPDVRRLLIEILSGPFAGCKSMIRVYVNGDGFNIDHKMVSTGMVPIEQVTKNI